MIRKYISIILYKVSYKTKHTGCICDDAFKKKPYFLSLVIDDVCQYFCSALSVTIDILSLTDYTTSSHLHSKYN